MSHLALFVTRQRLLYAGAFAASIILLFFFLLYRAASPHLLIPQGDYEWVTSPNPPSLVAELPQQRVSYFRATLQRTAAHPDSTVTLRSLGKAIVFVNGNPVGPSAPWRGRIESVELKLNAHLRPGDNEVVVIVRHHLGPAAIQMFALSPGSLNQPAWQVSSDGRNWSAAPPATAVGKAPRYLSRWNSLNELATHFTLLVGLAGFGAAVAGAMGRLPWLNTSTGAASALAIWRWTLLAMLGGVFAVNFDRLPAELGMDAQAHLEYVAYIVSTGSLPFSEQGWQMFQPPLAYLLGAGVERVRDAFFPALTQLEAARLLTMACTLLTAAIACRICEFAFRRAGTAAAAMALAVFLPAGVYLAHAFGNEPFAALFGTLLVLETTRLLIGEPGRRSAWVALRMGVWLGLGLLAKPTVLLMVPAVLGVVAWHQGGLTRWRQVLGSAGALVLVAFVISGWWYIRNIMQYGRPFVGGWELGRGWDWWQYPGFRVPDHWLRFGEALTHPYYAGLVSFWDGIYSSLWLDGGLSGLVRPDLLPPWNLSMMACLAVLSLPVMGAIVFGTCRGILRPSSAVERRLAVVGAINVAIFLAVMALIFAQVPSYSAAKGTYLVSAAAFLPLLFGVGIAPLMERPTGRIVVSAFMAVWLGFVVLGFAAG